jgi:membrane-bound lytic murein transglycosylase D
MDEGTTMTKRLLPLLCLLFLAGCAGSSHETREYKPRSNMEPEITGLEALKNSRGRPLTPAEKQALDSKAGIAFKLTPEETEEVRLFFQYFTRDKRDTVQRWMLRSEPHLEYVRAVFASHGLPQDLLALPYIESGYNVLAVSSSGAVGMWQFMPATARRFGLTVDWWLDERRDPYLATVAAARYLKALHAQFGDWQLALAAYNAGEGTISRAMTATGKKSFDTLAKSTAPLKEETKHYVPKFLAMLKITKNARKLGFNAPDLNGSKDLQEVRIPAGTDLSALAAHMNLSWEQFHALNPAFRRQVSPPDRTTAAYVPKKLAQSAQAFADKGASGSGGSGARLARGGESWWTLSRESGIPAHVLREANKNADAPAPGRPVLIPLAACALDAAGAPDPTQPVKTARGVLAKVSGPSREDAQAVPPASASTQPTLYVVRHGDTLESVSKKTGVGVQEIVSLNKANPKDALTPGTPLLIPAKAQAAAPAPVQAQSAAPAPARTASAPPARQQAAAQPASQSQAERPEERTELNPNPRYKIVKRSGS